jgi:amino acid transporter
MIFLGVMLCVGIMGGTIYLALDKKSSFITRIVSLVALALMILTVLICVFVAITDDTVPVDESVLIVGAPPQTKGGHENDTMILLLMIVFLLALFATIVILAIREHRKHSRPAK